MKEKPHLIYKRLLTIKWDDGIQWLQQIEAWRYKYNNFGPHSSWNGLIPDQVVKIHKKNKARNEDSERLPAAPDDAPIFFGSASLTSTKGRKYQILIRLKLFHSRKISTIGVS